MAGKDVPDRVRQLLAAMSTDEIWRAVRAAAALNPDVDEELDRLADVEDDRMRRAIIDYLRSEDV